MPKLKIFAKLKDILINSRASHLNSIVLHLKLKDFLSKLKYFSAKLKDIAAKLKISANLFAPDGGQTLKKQAWDMGVINRWLCKQLITEKPMPYITFLKKCERKMYRRGEPWKYRRPSIIVLSRNDYHFLPCAKENGN